MSKLAIFRTDASVDIGIGHLMRCATLAHTLMADGWACKFVMSEASRPFIRIANLQDAEIYFISLASMQNATAISDHISENADLVVIDHYALGHKFETACRAFGKTILSFDDQPIRKHDCDILLDQNFGRTCEDYCSLVPEHCEILVGADWALLRHEFISFRDKALKARDARGGVVNSVLISVGGSDPCDATSRILEGLNALSQKIHIDIVLSSEAPALNRIKMQAQTHQHWSLYVNTTEMAALISAADIVFGAGGTTSWERCCLGAPSILIQLADNQSANINGLTGCGAALFLGMANEFCADDVTKTMSTLMNNSQSVLAISLASRLVCDGYGVNRLIERLNVQ